MRKSAFFFVEAGKFIHYSLGVDSIFARYSLDILSALTRYSLTILSTFTWYVVYRMYSVRGVGSVRAGTTTVLPTLGFPRRRDS